jgi:O-antigen/teichoic acid export membrane protein
MKPILGNSKTPLNLHAFSLFVSFATSLILARNITLEQFGMFTFYLFLAQFSGRVLHLGVDAANCYYAPRTDRYTIISSSIIISLLTGLVVFSVAYLLFAFSQDAPTNYTQFAVAISFCAIFSQLKTLSTAYLVGVNKVSLATLVQTLDSSLALFLVFILLFFGFLNTYSALASFTASSCVASIFSVLICLVPTSHSLSNPPFYAYVKTAVSYGLPSWGNNIFNQLIYRADTLIIEFFLGPTTLGIYTISYQLVERVWTPLPPIVNSYIGSANHSSLSAMLSKLRSTSKIAISIVGCLSILIIPIVFLIPYIYGSSYAPSVLIAFLLLPGIVALSIPKVLVGFFAVTNTLAHVSVISCVSLVVNIVLNLILLHNFQLVGVAVSTTISYFVYALLSLIYYHSVASTAAE